MNEDVAKTRVVAALEALRYNDLYLLESRCHERSVAGRLLVYLSGVFPSHNVDAEYNRHGLDPKRADLHERCHEIGRDDALVIPDLVVHTRGNELSNLLVVEIKPDDCTKNELDCDRLKLTAIRAQFNYSHTALIQYPTGPKAARTPVCLEWSGSGRLEASA